MAQGFARPREIELFPLSSGRNVREFFPKVSYLMSKTSCLLSLISYLNQPFFIFEIIFPKYSVILQSLNWNLEC